MQNTLRSKLVFKDYNHNQNLLLPPSLEELILPNHPVRIVNQVVDNLNLDPILAKYEGGGCPPYHPRLMLKVRVYGYLTNQYSSRKIEQSLQQNIHFMWLSGMSYPDHNTINRFRSDRLRGVLREVFSQVVLLLVDHGHITLKEAYLDGIGVDNPMIPDDVELPLLLSKVHPIHEVVHVDYFLPGCPPPAAAFMKVLTDLMEGREPSLPKELLHYD